MNYVARKSNHIQEDIIRNWSSWNFGQEGFEGTKLELVELLNQAKENESSIWLSGFDIYPSKVGYDFDAIYADDYEIKELYANYWVCVDNINSPNGLSCIELNAESLEDAIQESHTRRDYCWDGDTFDANEYELVYSKDDIHIFILKD